MPMTSFETDRGAATITATYEVDVPAERAWQLWADPRQLERWWGPPTWPAKVSRFELEPDGVVAYTMTGTDGEEAKGWWRVRQVRAPRILEVDDHFGEPNQEANGLPVARMTVDITDRSHGCTMRMTTAMAGPAELDQLIEMGVEEGLRAAMSQIEDVLRA